jgi:phospholipase C
LRRNLRALSVLLISGGLLAALIHHGRPNVGQVFAVAGTVKSSPGQSAAPLRQENAPVARRKGVGLDESPIIFSPSYLYVLPEKPTILVGTSLQLAAFEYAGNGTITDVTAKSSWTVIESGIASVENSGNSIGLATALAPGQVLVQASADSLTGLANITVVSSLDLPPPGLTANASDGQVALTWTTLPGSTTFNVMRSSQEGGPYTTIATVPTPSYTDTGLRDGRSYYYVVVANYQDGGQSGISHEAVGTPLAPGAFKKIQHVVYIIKENHSFDNFFGTFPGANGATSGMTSNGQVVQLQELADPPPNDISHDWKSALQGTDGGRMDRFDLIVGGNMNGNLLAYSQFYQKDIPNYWSYASTFALGDGMYSSISSGSYAGHLYTMGATSVGVVDDPVSLSNGGIGWGCDAIAGTTAPTITDTDPEVVQAPYPCFNVNALANELQNAGVSWKSYAPTSEDSGYLWNSLRSFSQIFDTSLWQSNVVRPGEFVRDAMSHHMPAVSWLVANVPESEHPVDSVCRGENWTVQQINAIMQGPNWNSTAIFIVWDDFGGFYDHVPPPSQDLYGYSIRLPFIIVSPYAKQTVYGKQGYVTHSTYELSSVLRFIEERFGVAPLTSRDATANDILDAFDFSQRPLPPLVLPQRQCP